MGLLGGCSDNAADPPRTTVVNALTPEELQSTPATPATESGAETTTLPGSTIPARPPDDSAELMLAVGLSPDQAQCVVNSGSDGPFEVLPAPTPDGLIGLQPASGNAVAIPPALKTNGELERLLLANFASDCAPSELLDKLSALSGAIADADALEVDLPPLLARRTAQGATAAESQCIDAALRAAPARLSSFAAGTTLVELSCVSEARLAELRGRSYRPEFTKTGIPTQQIDCLVGSAADRNYLAELIEAQSSGAIAGEPNETQPLVCLNQEQLSELALKLVAQGASFGGEPLRWN